MSIALCTGHMSTLCTYLSGESNLSWVPMFSPSLFPLHHHPPPPSTHLHHHQVYTHLLAIPGMADEIDEQSLPLSIEPQAQDAAALVKGKQREDERRPDIDFATELYKYELQSPHMLYSDRALCLRLGDLGLEDNDAIRGRVNEAQPAPSKLKTTASERLASARSGEISTSATGASASAVAKVAINKTAKETSKETAKEPNVKAASLPSSNDLTSDTGTNVEIIEETTASPVTS